MYGEQSNHYELHETRKEENVTLGVYDHSDIEAMRSSQNTSTPRDTFQATDEDIYDYEDQDQAEAIYDDVDEPEDPTDLIYEDGDAGAPPTAPIVQFDDMYDDQEVTGV